MNLDIFGGSAGFLLQAPQSGQQMAGLQSQAGSGEKTLGGIFSLDATDGRGVVFPPFISLLSSDVSSMPVGVEGLPGEAGKGAGKDEGGSKGEVVLEKVGLSAFLGFIPDGKTSVQDDAGPVTDAGKGLTRGMSDKTEVYLKGAREGGVLAEDGKMTEEKPSVAVQKELPPSGGMFNASRPQVCSAERECTIQSLKEDLPLSDSVKFQPVLKQDSMESVILPDETDDLAFDLIPDGSGQTQEEEMSLRHGKMPDDQPFSGDGVEDTTGHQERTDQGRVIQNTHQQSEPASGDDGDGIPLPRTVKVAPERIEVRVEPEGLGRIDLSVGMKDGHLNAHIGVERIHSLVEIQENISQLFASLSDEGWTSGSFSFHLRDEGRGGYSAERGETQALENIDQPAPWVAPGILSIRV